MPSTLTVLFSISCILKLYLLPLNIDYAGNVFGVGIIPFPYPAVSDLPFWIRIISIGVQFI